MNGGKDKKIKSRRWGVGGIYKVEINRRDFMPNDNPLKIDGSVEEENYVSWSSVVEPHQ